MDKEYIAQIKNKNMEALLLKEDNIPILEDLLNVEAKRLKPIQKLKDEGKLNFGGKVDSKGLEGLLTKTKGEVDSFLETQTIDMPSCKYYNIFRLGPTTTPILFLYASSAFITICPLALMLAEQNPSGSYLLLSGAGVVQLGLASLLHSSASSPGYDPRSKLITLKKERRIELIPILGHEYAHHVQQRSGLEGGTSGKHSIFGEGQARGIERYLSETYRKLEDNEAFLYNILDMTISEMKKTYVWMCKELGKSTRGSLLKILKHQKILNLTGGGPSPHAKGNALFSIYEAKYGPQIYRDAIHGKFQFKPNINQNETKK